MFDIGKENNVVLVGFIFCIVNISFIKDYIFIIMLWIVLIIYINKVVVIIWCD